ncbi:MAG TPA: carboxypeptidase regulatory-like domain-containing protein [Gemmatimonadaceae bacterium]|nr:carboxypeptidase regulatory-like domain-containing protein [Gemmatimonadaceae bacterium]
MQRGRTSGRAALIRCAALVAGLLSPGAACAQGAPGTGSLHGIAFDSLAMRPMRGVQVVAVRENDASSGATNFAVTDATGGFAWPALAEGRYLVQVSGAWPDSAGLAPLVSEVVVHDGEASTVIAATPSARTLRALLCTGPATDTTDGGIYTGVVREVGTGTPLPNARVLAFWNDISVAKGARRVRALRRGAVVRTDADGVFRLCGLPVGLAMDVQAQYDTARYTGVVRLAIPASGVLVRGMLVDTAPGARRLGRVAGRVTADGETSLAAAHAWSADGSRSALTDANGRFALDSLPLGTQAITVTKVGFAPLDTVLDIGGAGPAVLVARMSPLGVMLDSIRTIATRAADNVQLSAVARGFNDRKAAGFGVFLTADEIARRDPPRTSTLFNFVRGFHVATDPQQLDFHVESSRGQVGLPSPDGTPRPPCRPLVYVNGNRMPDAGDVDIVSPSDILGIEVYQVGEPSPAQFPTGQCGAVLIWTR